MSVIKLAIVHCAYDGIGSRNVLTACFCIANNSMNGCTYLRACPFQFIAKYSKFFEMNKSKKFVKFNYERLILINKNVKLTRNVKIKPSFEVINAKILDERVEVPQTGGESFIIIEFLFTTATTFVTIASETEKISGCWT